MDIKIDFENNDLAFEDGDLVVVDGDDCVKQQISTGLHILPLDWFLDNDPERYQCTVHTVPDDDFPFHLVRTGGDGPLSRDGLSAGVHLLEDQSQHSDGPRHADHDPHVDELHPAYLRHHGPV